MLIPLEGGAQAFVIEVQHAAPDEVDVVIGGMPEQAPLIAPGQDETLTPTRYDVVVSAQTHPYLRSHEINGQVVLPLVTVQEWFTRAAADLMGKAFRGEMRKLRVLKGVPLPDFETAATRSYRVKTGWAGRDCAASHALRCRGRASLRRRNRAPGPTRSQRHAGCRAQLAASRLARRRSLRQSTFSRARLRRAAVGRSHWCNRRRGYAADVASAPLAQWTLGDGSCAHRRWSATCSHVGAGSATKIDPADHRGAFYAAPARTDRRADRALRATGRADRPGRQRSNLWFIDNSSGAIVAEIQGLEMYASSETPGGGAA